MTANSEGSNSRLSRIRRFFFGVDQYIDERLKSPFFWSFAFAWLILNWEVPLTMIFESEAVSVDSMRKIFSTKSYWYHFGPFLFSFGYIILIRPIMNFLSGVGQWFMGLSQKFHDYILLRSPITHEALAREKTKVRDLEIALRTDINNIDKLKVKIEELQKENDTYSSQVEILEATVSARETEVTEKDNMLRVSNEQLKEQIKKAELYERQIEDNIKKGKDIEKFLMGRKNEYEMLNIKLGLGDPSDKHNSPNRLITDMEEALKKINGLVDK